ncbi:MAG: ATP-dependent RNA helicase SUPV3L1/SUV3 [Hyphomicrobiaceae bacterium]|jgi:ATP-dependent RNA helicase SUPV3L1/SUV3
MGVDQMTRIRNVTAVLGPTNTGKTHLAIERMLGHQTGMIGLPLRLLAREIYDRVANRVGADKVALITGEEKIKPEGARYWICTVEAMPQDITVDFLAIDEIQLAADLDRGHVFTDRLLHARGEMETLVLGASTMRAAISDLIPGANFISRPRLSKLSYAGQKKITRLPARSAIVAFSASDVYAIAELIRSQRGGAAVVLGALSPRTRNAQVALYQSGDVDFLVATDAIGMGLNLDVDHVSFSNVRKFDGQKFRDLTAAELAQIAGRAGRHMNDGTFGVTGDAEPLDQGLVDRLEDHEFDSIKTLQWRARELDFSSVDGLRDSLRALPDQFRLMRARSSDDFDALESVARDPDVVRMAQSAPDVEALWEVCQIPDYRKISSQNHAELVASVFKDLKGASGHIDEDWFAKQVAFSDRIDGDIDTLSNRLAHIRTWTFVANRQDWLKDPGHWQTRTREIEDSLSDALHACLTQRFVDARASALMKGMKDNQELSGEIGDDGSIHVESHFVGSLKGFRYIPDTQADGLQGKTTRNAANQVLSKEMSMRTRRLVAAKNDAFTLTRTGQVVWRGDEIAKLDAAEDPLKPQVALIADDILQGADRERVMTRVQAWVADTIAERLKPLVDLGKAEDVDGLARGVGFRLTESVGVLKRDSVAEEMKALDQPARAQLRRYGVRFGAFNVFFPILLKPAAADLLLTLWCVRYGKENGLDPAAPPEAPRAGLTSTKVDPAIPEAFYRAYGFHVCGPRAVRIDMLERLADLIRPLLSWRVKSEGDTPPKGSTGDGGFTVIPEMMSILGCSPEELGNVLAALGFRLEKREAPKPVPAPEAKPAVATDDAAAPDALLEAAVSTETTAAADEPTAAPSDGNAPEAAQDSADNSESAPAEAAASPIAETTSDTTTPDPVAVSEPSSTAPTETSDGDTPAPSDVTPTPEKADEAAASASATVASEDEAKVETAGEPAPEVEASADAPSADAPAEPVMIEIWRPRRRHDGGQRRSRPPRRGAQNNGQSDQKAAGQTGSNQAGNNQAGGGPSSGERDGQSRPDRAAGPRGDRNNNRRDGGAKPNERGPNQNGPNQRGPNQHGSNQHGKGGGNGRGKPRFDKSGGGRRDDKRGGVNVHSSAPARPKGMDPDSPFAALSALKDNLKKGDTDS